MELSTLIDGNLSFCGRVASYSKMQEAYLYAKFKGEISGIEINFFNHKQNIACSFKIYKQDSVLFDI